MNSFAVIRADDINKVRVTICDLMRYAHLTLDGNAKRLDPTFADNILVHIMKSPLKCHCESSAIVPLKEEASAAIGRLRKIHPPAHVIIVSPRHEIYHELINYVRLLPDIEINLDWTKHVQQDTMEIEKIRG